MKLEEIKILTIILAIIFSAAFPYQYLVMAQENSNADSLEQISPEDLQNLESQIDSIISSQSSLGETKTKNDFDVDLIWKADTFVPPDYEGKALPAVETMVTVYASVNVENPQALHYTWVVEDSSSFSREGPNLSGIGKDTFGFITQRIPEFKHSIKVTVQNKEAYKSATVQLEIPTFLPEANIYIINNENYNNISPQTIKLQKGKESGLMAKAFYFNAKGLNDLDFAWKLDGKKQEDSGSKPYVIPITIAERTEVGTYFQLKSEITSKKMSQNVFERANKTTEIRVVK